MESAHALRVAAGAIALITVGKHLATDLPAATERDVAVLRGLAAALALGLALLSSPRRSVAQLRGLAFALGLDVVFVTVGVTIVVPAAAWEQSVSLVAMMFAAAVFMPWSWRWQAALVAISLAVATVALTLAIPRGALEESTVVRVLFTLSLLGALSVVGAELADHARRQIEASAGERRAHEQRQIEEQRVESLARLAGGLAHQFNNILGGILTHAAVLRDEVSRPEAQAAADEILEAARRGRKLTKELLGFSRPETAAVRPTAAAELVASAAVQARTALPAEMEVRTDVAPGLPPFLADADQVINACLEIVFNARDAMRRRPNAQLTFTAAEETVAERDPRWPNTPPGRYVRIALRDTGRGMDRVTAERVFDPFFTTKPMHQAEGLGLAAVHRIMRDHRGAVRIESELGRGTTVHLLLPVAGEAAAAPAAAQRERGRPATILIVDDEAIVRNSLKRALTRFGYQVLEAGDGGSALAAMQAAQPPVDLVILDLVLPGGGAGIFELLKAVRPDVKVLISSGYSPDGEAARGLATRVEGFLPKPYELSHLREAVTRALGA